MQNQFYQTPFQKRSNASEFRSAARDALKNRWGLAIGVFLLACLLGLSSGSMVFSDSEVTAQIEEDPLGFWQKLQIMDELLVEQGVSEAARYVVHSIVGVDVLWGMASTALFALALGLFVGAPVTVGYHRFLLDFVDQKPEVGVRTLFSAFSTCYWKSVLLKLLLGVIYWGVGVLTLAVLFVVLTFAGLFGSVLLLLMSIAVLIGGAVFAIVLEYNLSICYFIMAEYPDLAVMDVIRNSWMLMRGNKWRLFCLEISFIGWMLAACCTCGLGFIALSPYMYTANAAFYMEISGHDTAKEVEFPSIDPDDYFPQI